MTDEARANHLAGLSKLDSEAMRNYDYNNPEEREAVEAGLVALWPRVIANKARHQPAPMKGDAT